MVRLEVPFVLAYIYTYSGVTLQQTRFFFLNLKLATRRNKGLSRICILHINYPAHNICVASYIFLQNGLTKEILHCKTIIL